MPAAEEGSEISAIKTEDLTRYFGDLAAVDAVDLEIGDEVFGLLGPNGAGKSTIVKILTTLLRPGRGRAYVCGYDVEKRPAEVRAAISYVPQEMALDVSLTGRENVDFFARLYRVRNRRDRVDEVIGLMGLSDRADEPVRGYSGGMRRRLELAQALVHEPAVLFLDEPTLGLDVRGRQTIWEHISALKAKGMAIFVTTHYMDEADRYCDRVAFMDRGKIVATGAPRDLKSELGPGIVTATVVGGCRLAHIEGVHLLQASGGELKFLAEDGEKALPAISGMLAAQGSQVLAMSVRGPTLDDVFLHQVTTREESTGFDAGMYRKIARRR